MTWSNFSPTPERTTQAVQVKSVVECLIDEQVPSLIRDGIEISVTGKQHAPFFTDKNRLEIVLTHLISNAIQFQDESNSSIEVGIDINVTPTLCSIQVRDNGIGISSSVLPHIFQLFYRGSEKSTGSGVGLYIVK